MKRTFSAVMAMLLMLSFLFGCRNPDAPIEDDVITGEVTIYTSQSSSEQQLFTRKFHELYPEVTINWVSGSLAQSIERLEQEKSDPQCDVLMGGLMQSDGAIYHHLFQPYVPYRIEEQSVIDEEHFYQYYITQVMAFLVNTAKLEELGLSLNDIHKFTDLLKPQLKGQILFGDPAGSAGGFRSLTTVLAVFGDGEVSAGSPGWFYMRNLMENLNGVYAAKASDVTQFVDSGDYAIGISTESACIQRLVNKVPDIAVVYPEEGNTQVRFAAAMVKNCKNPELAGKVIDYLLSKEYAEERTKLLGASRSTNMTAQISEMIPEVSALKLVELNFEKVTNNREGVLFKYGELWDYLGGARTIVGNESTSD